MRITVVDGDLLDQDVEVIVNAWNRNIVPWWLLIPQGVSKAIRRRAGTGPAAAWLLPGGGRGGGAATGGAGGGGSASLTRLRPFFGMAGAISRFVTSVAPQTGHSTKPASACASKPALSLNQPSNSCPAVQRRS